MKSERLIPSRTVRALSRRPVFTAEAQRHRGNPGKLSAPHPQLSVPSARRVRHRGAEAQRKTHESRTRRHKQHHVRGSLRSPPPLPQGRRGDLSYPGSFPCLFSASLVSAVNSPHSSTTFSPVRQERYTASTSSSA
jgi:hypothetical protein